MRHLLFAGSLLIHLILCAQDKPIQRSEHGWNLSPHGTIRILLIFAEIDYDRNPANDPQPGGAEHWPKGELPKWRDEVFDARPLDPPVAMVSKYYHDISFGQYVVLGDHIDQVMTIRESEHGNVGNAHGLGTLAVKEANKMGTLRTRHGSTISDFDMWKRGGRPGLPKQPGADDPHSYDHVMVILRNSRLTHGQGSVDGGSPGALFGFQSDSQSRFGAMNGLPFEILKHEYNHLLLGGNNFHSGGGNAAQFQSYFISLQGGWSMMGAASSSLLTCSGWDRQRMNWGPPGGQFTLNARDANGQVVNGDLDPLAGDTGVFVLRDFITTGDVLRLKLPFIPEDRHQQWLWIENHYGSARNGSYTDRFHWEGAKCVDPVEPGLFMMMQVDREDREGTNIYGGHSDYLRPVLATGSYDVLLRGDTIRNTCPFGGTSIPYLMDESRMNPFTGNHEQELVRFDKEPDGVLRPGEHYAVGTRIRRGRQEAELVLFGRPDHAFRMNGKRRIGMGTNPSTANMQTMLNVNARDLHGNKAPNVRTIYLNGISVNIAAMADHGEITVQVRANDTRLTEDVRWCADSIVLPPLRGHDGNSMTLAPRVRLVIDRSATPTKITAMDTVGSRIYFSVPTRLSITEGAIVSMEENSLLDLRNDSEVHLLPGSKLVLQRKARIRIPKSCSLVVHANAKIEGEARLIAKLRRRGRIVDGF